MKTIEELFVIHRARSGLFKDYKAGQTAYVGNGLSNNAIVGFVNPLANDKVFRFTGIVLSAFCEATVQSPPFIACGRAGNGLLALEPRGRMTIAQLAYIASYVNLSIRWRFNWYRQVTADRVRRLAVPDKVPRGIRFHVNMPSLSAQGPMWTGRRVRFGQVCLASLYDFSAGTIHSLSELAPGSVPVVSCGDQDNGVSGYCDAGEPLYDHKLTIAFNGMNTLTAKYHPYQFAAKDDVAVCSPNRKLLLTTEIFVQMAINRERWRYSYYRKCFIDKLRRLCVPLPVKAGKIDEDAMRLAIESSPYWPMLRSRLGNAT